MPVAKTYSNMPLEGEPFKENGRMYINVHAPKGIKKVRWYTEAEYIRMYPDAIIKNEVVAFNARDAFGFREAGYITLYKGNNIEEWAENDRRSIWYNLTFGYYTPSHLELPIISNGIEAVQLNWNDVAAKGNMMKPHEEVRKIVSSMLHKDSTSEYRGEINEWLQESVTVKEKKTKESHFGTKHTYTLEDIDRNIYVWETGAKDYATAQIISLKMKVKEHKEINGEKVTVVWYCKEV